MLINQAFSAISLDRKSLPQGNLDITDRVRRNLFPWTGQFSPQLVEELLTAYAPRDGVVLDPFVGSGTSLVEAALAADADAAQTSVSAVIRDALARGLPLARDARRKRRSGPRSRGGARDGAQTLTGLDRVATTTRTPGEGVRADNDPVQPAAVKTLLGNRGRE